MEKGAAGALNIWVEGSDEEPRWDFAEEGSRGAGLGAELGWGERKGVRMIHVEFGRWERMKPSLQSSEIF